MKRSHQTRHHALGCAITALLLVSGCATLQDLVAEVSGEGGAKATNTPPLKGLPEGTRKFTPAEAQTQKDGWSLLTANDIRNKGICKALAESSPIKEYFKINECHVGKKGRLGWMRGDTGEGLNKFDDTCSEGMYACSFVQGSIESKDTPEFHKLFQGLLLMHDPLVVKALYSSPSYAQFFGGSFLQKNGFRFFDGIDGIGIIGDKKDRAYLDGLVDQEWKVKSLGRDLRNKVAMAFWRMSDASGADMMMRMMEPEHTKRYHNREFRLITLGATSMWGSDAAVDYCKKLMRDMGSEDRAGCMHYLVSRGQKGLATTMVRYVEESGEEARYALGKTREKAARDYLAKQASQEGMGVEPRIAYALTGAPSSWKMLEGYFKDDPNLFASTLRGFTYFAGTPEQAKALNLIKKLQKRVNEQDEESLYTTFMATRAQLGDKSAVDVLIQKLNSPEEDVRDAALDGIGARWGQTISHVPPERIVADARLLPALATAFEAESDSKNRKQIAWAALNIRAKLRAQGK